MTPTGKTDGLPGGIRDEQFTVVIPAYNEEEAIGQVVQGIRETVPGMAVLIIDDGSTDATSASAAEAGARVVRHDDNQGYGAAPSTGVKHARTEFLVFVDADGQHDPRDIPRLAAEIADHDMVVGARDRSSHVAYTRRPGNKVLSLFADYLAKEHIPDVNSGFRVVRREVLLKCLHLMPQGFSFSTTSTFALLKGGWRIQWAPITVKRRLGTSTVRQLRHGPQTLMLMLRLTVLFDPLRVFLPLSGVLMFLALVMAVMNFMFYRVAVPATAVFLGISSVIMFMMGLVTDQVSAIRREMHE